MSDPTPTPEDLQKARDTIYGLIFYEPLTGVTDEDAQSLALEFARVRAESRKAALEEAAALLVQVRCRVWSPEECALAVRTMDHPPECSCHRWVDCAPRAGGAS